MKCEHLLDLSRLDVLRDAASDALSEARSLSQKMSDLRRQIEDEQKHYKVTYGSLEEMGRLVGSGFINHSESGKIKVAEPAKLREQHDAKIDAIKAEMKKLSAMQEEASEKRRAVDQLLRRCEKFMGLGE